MEFEHQLYMHPKPGSFAVKFILIQCTTSLSFHAGHFSIFQKTSFSMNSLYGVPHFN